MLLAVCRIVALSPVTNVKIQPEVIKDTCKLVTKYLNAADVNKVREVEEKIDDNWNSVVPFLELAFLPIAPLCQSEGIRMEDVTVLQQLAVFSLIVELGRARLQEVTFKESLQEYTVCLLWVIVDGWQRSKYSEVLMKGGLFKGSLPVPRLSTIVRARLSTFVGLRNVLQPAAQVLECF